MARQILKHHLSLILAAAERRIQAWLVEDRPVFLQDSRWTPGLADEVYRALVKHPDLGADDFITKLTTGKSCQVRFPGPAQEGILPLFSRERKGT